VNPLDEIQERLADHRLDFCRVFLVRPSLNAYQGVVRIAVLVIDQHRKIWKVLMRQLVPRPLVSADDLP